jgi:cell division protein FtsI (penicillin-binding protein 3)
MRPPSVGDRKRLVCIALFVCALFSLVLLQFYKIQIIEGDRWTKAAEAQHRHVVIEPSKRGLFYSNVSIKKGHPEELQPFVIDIPKFHLFIDPNSIPDPFRQEIALQLSSFLNLSHQEQERVKAQFYKKSRSRKLVQWLDKKERDHILHWWFIYARDRKIVRNALYFVQDYKRSYPFGKLLGQLLHSVREEDHLPTGGLETMFNKYLQGKNGKRVILRSPRHPLDTGEVLSPPEDGADVYLTINHYLQAIAEEEIAKGVQSAHAKSGWAIMMHPKSGEIFALAQYPSFEPAFYSKFFNDPKLREETKVKAVTDAYEPGSTIKPLTIAICLKANEELKKRGQKPLFSPHEKIETANSRFPGRSTPIKDMRTHHYLNMYLALQKSSDVYMARLIQRVIERLGAHWYRNALQEIFGFGLKTGIELPSETAGMLPTPGKKYANGALEWSAPTPYSLSYGYNLLVNSIQMLRSYAILANGGYDVQPTLVRKIVKSYPDGREEILCDNTSPERIEGFRPLLEPEIVKEVVKGMKYVTKPGGTASRGDIYGYTEVGKTGSAEKVVGKSYSKKTHFSTFIGFAPLSDPQFVLLIAIDEPEWKYIPGVGRNHLGGGCSAPVFRALATEALHYLGVAPDDPHGYPVADPRYDPDKADWMKEVRLLKELYQEWNAGK